jgi:hypothetical protein
MLAGAMFGALGGPLGSLAGAAIGGTIGAAGYAIYDALNPETNSQDKTRKQADKKGNDITDMFNDPLNQRIFRDEIVGGGERTRASANLGMIAANINNFGVQESIRLGAFPVY